MNPTTELHWGTLIPKTRALSMDYSTSFTRPDRPFSSTEILERRKQDINTSHKKWTVAHSSATGMIFKEVTLADNPEPICRRNKFKICQSTIDDLHTYLHRQNTESLVTPLISTSTKSESDLQAKHPHLLQNKSDSIRLPASIKEIDKNLQIKERKPLEINAQHIISLLNQLKSRKGCFDILAVSCIKHWYDCRGESRSLSTDIDSDWLEYLLHDLMAIEKGMTQDYNYRPIRESLIIQQLIFTIIKFKKHYHESRNYNSNLALHELEQILFNILQEFYLLYGKQNLLRIFDSNTYTRQPTPKRAYDHPKDFSIVKNTLDRHLTPETKKYKPHFLIPLLSDNISESTIQKTLKINNKDLEVIKELQVTAKTAKERELRENLCRNRPIDASLEEIEGIAGFKNPSSTCFFSVSILLMINFIQAYSSQEEREFTPRQKEASAAKKINNEGCDLLSLMVAEPNAVEAPNIEQILTFLDNEERTDQKRALFQKTVKEVFSVIISKYQASDHSGIQNAYIDLIKVCIHGVIQGDFSGFEIPDYIKTIEGPEKHEQTTTTTCTVDHHNQNKPSITPKDLDQQDCAWLVTQLMPLLLNEHHLENCSFYHLTQRIIMRRGQIINIVSPPVGASQILTIGVPDYKNQQECFSLQTLIDHATSYTSVDSPVQEITITPEDLNLANNPDFIDTKPLAQGTMTDKKWSVLQERDLLLADKPPRILIIQVGLPHSLDVRGRFVQDMSKDDNTYYSVPFRNTYTKKEVMHYYYEVTSIIFHAEQSPENHMTRHYRFAQKHPGLGWILTDDEKSFLSSDNTGLNFKCGCPYMFVLKQKAANEVSGNAVEKEGREARGFKH